MRSGDGVQSNSGTTAIVAGLVARPGGKKVRVSSHQTIRLTRGRHASPERGACVMEVASMLAGEPFTDEPRSVCPVIAEFLRTYNDQVDDERRQDLYPYAALVVGTRADAAAERRRAELCLDWWLASSSPRRIQLRRFLWMLPPTSAARDVELAHRTARWAAGSPKRHHAALELVETLAGRSPMRVDANWLEEQRVAARHEPAAPLAHA
jgi:hypothetical protein